MKHNDIPLDESINPLVSIVILVKNGGAVFKQCLSQVLNQDFKYKYEVIVIDSGSTDRTIEYLNGKNVRLIHIDSGQFQFGKTRDFGFSNAYGKYIVTLSADAVPTSKQWLTNLISPLIKNHADVVQGNLVTPPDKDLFYWEKINEFYFTSEGKEFIANYGGFGLSCCNIAFNKIAWRNTKFGNSHFCEDKVIQRRLFIGGYLLLKVNNANVFHTHRYTINTLIKRCNNEGIGWRNAGVNYSLQLLFHDIFFSNNNLFLKLFNGIINQEITKLSEIVFPIVRPFFLFKGNHSSPFSKE